jgi:hypothetical protein
MDVGQKTPRGHPDLNSYVKNLGVLVFITDRQTDRQTDKKTEKFTRCAWAGGTFFPVVLVRQFFGFWLEIGFGVTYLHI